VLTAIDYIKQHDVEVRAEYRKMLERDARGNAPELLAKLDAIHAKYQARWAERKQQREEASHASDNGRS
jgi:hypothetical protein